jgi:hypothetical protein
LQLRLRSDNPEFPALFVDAEDTSALRVVAELERVLWPSPSPSTAQRRAKQAE